MEIKLNEHTLNKQEDIEISEENKQEAVNLLVFTLSISNAIGMSAPQVGIEKRMCIVRDEKRVIVAINPHITAVEGPEMIKNCERCLSWPDKLISTERYPKIRVKYFDVIRNQEYEEDFEGYTSIIWQHELDHLDGVKENIVEKDFRTVRKAYEVGRNDLCICGSGKKYKKCCLNKER
jgi:peptide deformylase